MRVPKVKFLLREPNAKKVTPIYLVMRFEKQRLFYFTGEHSQTDEWDFVNNRVKSNKKIVGATDINHRLDKLEFRAKEIFRGYAIDGKFISPIILKKELDNDFNSEVRKDNTTFLGFVEQYIEECKSVKGEGTIKSYKTTLHRLQNFKKKRIIDVEFEAIDIVFYNKFRDYLNKDLNLALNTVGSQFKNIKIFLNEATQRGINKNLAFRDKGFKKTTEDVKHIFLNKNEIERVSELKLSAMPSWELVRDVFVIGCYTGLRFQDLANLTEKNIKRENGNEFIEIITNKTGERVLIPMAKVVREILRKYNLQIPKVYSNQKFNAYLKMVAQRAELNEAVEVVKTVGGKKQNFEYKKWELVTTHTARRSFATNAYLSGLPVISIMKMTGHRSEQVFMKYISISQEENAQHIMEHRFFQ